MTYSLVSSSYADYTTLAAAKPTYLELITAVIEAILTITGDISPATANYDTSTTGDLPAAAFAGPDVWSADLLAASALTVTPSLDTTSIDYYSDLDAQRTSYQGTLDSFATYDALRYLREWYKADTDLPSATGTSTSGALTSSPTAADLSSTAVLTSDLTWNQFSTANPLSSTPASTSAVDYTAGASATLSSAGTVTSAIDGGFPVGAALTSAPGLTADGFVSRPTTAALASTAGIPTATVVERPTTAALSAAPGQSSNAVRTVPVDTALAATASLTSNITVATSLSTTLSATPASTVAADRAVLADAALSSTAAIVSSIDVFTDISATLTSTPSSTSAVSHEVGISSTLTSTPSSVSNTNAAISASADLASSPSVTSAADRLAVIASILSSTPTIVFTVIGLYSDLEGQLPSYDALVTNVSSYDALRGFGELFSSGIDPMEITPAIVADAGVVLGSPADLTSTPGLTAGASVPYDITAALSATAALTSDALIERPVTSDLSSTPELTTGTSNTTLIDSALAATSTLSGDIAVNALAVVNLSSTATMRAISLREYDEVVTAYPTYDTLLFEVVDYESLAKGLIFDSGIVVPSVAGDISADAVRTQFSDTAGTAVTATIVADIDAGPMVTAALSATPGSTADITPTRPADAVLAATGDLTAASGTSQSIAATLSATGAIRSTTVDEYADLEVAYATYDVLLYDVGDYQALLAGFQGRTVDAAISSTAELSADLSVLRSTTADLSATPELASDALSTRFDESALSATPVLTADAALHVSSSVALAASASLRTILVTSYDDVLSGYPTYDELAIEVSQYATLLSGFQTRTVDAALAATSDLQADSVYEQLTYIDVNAASVLISTAERDALLDLTLTASPSLSADLDRVAVADAALSATASTRPAIVNSYTDVEAFYLDYATLDTDVQTYATLTLDYATVTIDADLTASSTTSTSASFDATADANLTGNAVVYTSVIETYTDLLAAYPQYRFIPVSLVDYSRLDNNSGIVHTADTALEASAELYAAAAGGTETVSADLSASGSIRTGRVDSYDEVVGMYDTYDVLLFDVQEYFWLERNSGITITADSDLSSTPDLFTDAATEQFFSSDLTATASLRTGYHQSYLEVDDGYPTYEELAYDVGDYSWLVLNTTSHSVSADLTGTAGIRTGRHDTYGEVGSGYPTYAELEFDVETYTGLWDEATGRVFGIEADLVSGGALWAYWETPETYQRITFLQSDYQTLISAYMDYQSLVPSTEGLSVDLGNPSLSYWDGRTWQSGTLRYTTDSSVTDGTLNYWDGSQWTPAV